MIDRQHIEDLAFAAARRLAGPLFAVPGPLRRILFGAPMRSDRGVEMDPQCQVICKVHGLLAPYLLDGVTPQRMRAVSLRNSALVAEAPPPGVVTEDLRLSADFRGLPVRIYRPPGGRAPLPVLVYYHGGGFVVGDLATYDVPCRILASEGQCLVLSVDYGLAPESPFPGAVEDAVEAYRWASIHAPALGADPSRVAVGGDSAGGNLAAVVSLAARERRLPPPALQVLVYPATDLTLSMPSHRTFASGCYLTADTIRWFLRQYLTRPEQARDWRASPLLADDHAGLPPAIVVTAGFDPLRDEGDAYAQRLREAGVTVTSYCEERLIHAFANMGGASPAAATALARVAAEVRRVLSSR